MNEEYRVVSDLKTLNTLVNYSISRPEVGDIFFCEEDEKKYIITPGYEEIKESSSPGMSLYDFNKGLIAQMPELADTNKSIAKAEIINWSNIQKNQFYMLYGKEISYFTIFMIDNDNAEINNLGNAVFECLDPLGAIISIEKINQEGFEIWVKDNEKVFCLYLFPYDQGIVRIEG